MNVSFKAICLAAAGAVSLAGLVAGTGAAAACDINSATDISCGPISMNPANPLSPLNMSNPANPASPLNPSNINNPSNPASPLNWSNSLSNPANPLSPLNPMNQARQDGYYDGDSDYGAYSAGGLLSSLFGEDAAPQGVTPPDGYEPENYPAAHHRHHHRHKRID